MIFPNKYLKATLLLFLTTIKLMGTPPEFIPDPAVLTALSETKIGYQKLANEFAVVCRYLSEHENCLNPNLRTFVGKQCVELQTICDKMTLSVDSVISLLSDLVHCSIDVCSLVVGVATFNATCLQLVTSMNTFNEHFLSFWEKPENQNTLSAILFKTFSRQSIRTIFIIIFSSIISLTLGSEACAHWRLQMEQIYEHENRFIQYIKHLTRVYLEHNSVGT